MSSPELLAERVRPPAPPLATVTGHAMATRITITITSAATDESDDGVTQALAVFQDVDKTCTRFDPTSALMQANRTPTRWHRVPATLFAALVAAKRAHDLTKGRFDPRVLRRLCDLGYDRTLPFGREPVRIDGACLPWSSPMGPWRPRFRGASQEVLLGPEPVDLGGIGKGLAIRWATEALGRHRANFLLEAGGDCYAAGSPPEEPAWRIGIEDPAQPGQSAAVLALCDAAVTTSSIRLRHWQRQGRRVHHLLDPRTGEPGGRGLVSVTVVGEDPADAEVWSKVLFLEGRSGVASRAARLGLAALWIDERGELAMTPQIERYLLWRRA